MKEIMQHTRILINLEGNLITFFSESKFQLLWLNTNKGLALYVRSNFNCLQDFHTLLCSGFKLKFMCNTKCLEAPLSHRSDEEFFF